MSWTGSVLVIYISQRISETVVNSQGAGMLTKFWQHYEHFFFLLRLFRYYFG